MTHPHGLYDLLLTESVARALDPERATTDPLHPEEAAARLVEALRSQLGRLLDEINLGGSTEKLVDQLRLTNEVLRHVRTLRAEAEAIVDPVAEPARVLRAVSSPAEPTPDLPDTGLWAPWLFTAGRGSPSLLNEIRRETAACDRIDILVSFITVSGVRKLIDVLRSITAANAAGLGRTKIRVLTTTYMGATEVRALDEIAWLNGAEVRVSLDGRRTRLHAKAWIFHRKSGFGSAYVGSANLSGAALMGGLEWTVKFTERGQEALYARAKAHFDTLWSDEEFTPYQPQDAESRAAVVEALKRETGEYRLQPGVFFDIQPKPFQREMLEHLAYAREHGRHRNLVVSATGTGKTVVAALDYRSLAERLGHRPRLLYVAHRSQILRQAMRTYREVLRDHSFGEVLSGGVDLGQNDYLFATIHSLSSRRMIERLGADYWHVVVIDECHRLAADRFHRLATAVRPAELIGLTATPERTDGQSIAPYFSQRPDGAPAVELRLWDALDMQLLAPFEYYACDDETDFSEVPWDRPGEVAAIDSLVTGNQVRARLVIDEWYRLAAAPRNSRAVVFCVSVAHARFMTDQFSRAGLPALCVVGDTTQADRLRAVKKLEAGEVCALVTVDLYNEGVDIPSADTLLMLRPTQSALLFQQQIGRGLRLWPGKDSCLVLDFVGHHRADFRFDRLLSSVTGLTRNELIEAVEHGFSSLPPGCHLHLERRARQQILSSLRTLARQTWPRLRAELSAYATFRGTRSVTLADFLRDQRVLLNEVYRPSNVSGWTTLRRAAGLLTGPETEGEADLSRRFRYLLHINDPTQLSIIQRIAEAGAQYAAQSHDEAVRMQMLTYQVDTSREPKPYATFLSELQQYPHCLAELGQLAALLEAQSTIRPVPLPGVDDVPLTLHAGYSRREILTAFGVETGEKRAFHREGVLPLLERKCEVMFVTLDKSRGFHDRIAYHDYAVSPRRFHWQTQNSAGPDTPSGERYLQSRDNGWTFQLFVRSTPAEPYHACGPVYLAAPDDISGDRPMSIEWTLEVPLSPRLFAEFSVLRGQA